VSDRLREKVGKREIKFSLGTSDPELAKIRQAQELARWRAASSSSTAKLIRRR
jgi:hypothetical protein